MTTSKTNLKVVNRIKKAPPVHWVGDGFPVRSMFSYNTSAEALSPFLLLDYAAPVELPPSDDEPKGVGEHPHRGFETVTIVYQGEVEHRDSAGHHGRIGPGDVQWMTAASGIVHQEKHGHEFTRKGGTMEMVQLWVNLPAKFKMSPPKYQEILSQQIPAVQLSDAGGTVRVIAGEFQGTKGPARTFTPVNLWDLLIKAGHTAELDVPEGHTTLLLVLRGDAMLNGSERATEAELVEFDRRGDTISIDATETATLLLMSGKPIEEPVVGSGPFVMNTQTEIREAIQDYQAGKMGRPTS
ncbi:MAG: pirin family protein [Terriglobia bacterium]